MLGFRSSDPGSTRVAAMESTATLRTRLHCIARAGTRIAATAMLSLAMLTALCAPASATSASPSPGHVASAPKRFDLPPTTGPYRVGTAIVHLVDRSRIDLFVGGPREIMVTIAYPIQPHAQGPRAAWIDPALVGDIEALYDDYGFVPGSIDWAGARRPAIEGAALKPSPRGWPVVLFSPGLQFFRELYSASVDDLASHGYVVASMTHTYEAFFAAFPGGRVARGVELTETVESTQMWLDTRVADSRFVLDALSAMNQGRNPDAEHRRLPAGFRGGLDLSRVGFFGHSYGGTTAAETMFFDRRFDAGIDFDGRLSTTYGPPQDLPYGPTRAARFGLDKPFLLMGAAGYSHRPVGEQDRSWVDFWSNQRGWKREVQLPLGLHFSFSDYPAFVPRLSDAAPAGFLQLANGSMPAAESVAGSRAYVRAFFDLHLKHRPTWMFDAPHPAYPNFELVP
ncbi:lipase [Lysobacter sp. Root690]|uniref:alpha/beta hydrolase n=1 Tax=Lysobacter sp. Root690 TaxID=1736588 RepID=UPI000AB0ED8B|nr:lipase [Lysobacter sp. Root690]